MSAVRRLAAGPKWMQPKHSRPLMKSCVNASQCDSYYCISRLSCLALELAGWSFLERTQCSNRPNSARRNVASAFDLNHCSAIDQTQREDMLLESSRWISHWFMYYIIFFDLGFVGSVFRNLAQALVSAKPRTQKRNIFSWLWRFRGQLELEANNSTTQGRSTSDLGPCHLVQQHLVPAMTWTVHAYVIDAIV